MGLQKCPPWVKIARLTVLEEISFNFQFSFMADVHFSNYYSLDFRLLGSLIRRRPAIELIFDHRYSSYPSLLTAQFLQISLGPFAVVRLAVAEAGQRRVSC